MGERPADEYKRIGYIDLFRGIGIIFMIMGHIGYGSAFNKWIHAFHMPMFFFVSGWFFRPRGELSALQYLKKKVQKLLLPYLCFELFLWFICCSFISEYRTWETAFYIFFDNSYKIPVLEGTHGISPVPGAMWFLTAIFFCEIIYDCLDWALSVTWKLHVIVAGLSVVGMIAPILLPFRLPWSLDASFVGIGIFHIARVLRSRKTGKLFDLHFMTTVMIGLIVSASILICPSQNMRTGSYGGAFPFWINAFAAIVVGWNLSKHFELFFQKGKYRRWILDWLKSVGHNSVVYLCLNQIVVLVLTEMLYAVGVGTLAMKLIMLPTVMVLLRCCEKLICGTSLRVMIGRPFLSTDRKDMMS